MIEATLLAVALAMDAFAVALAQGARFQPRAGHALVVATAFGVAQGAMAAIGWLLGEVALSWIAAIDHWIAFILLAGIGIMMLRGGDEDDTKPLLGGAALFAASIATSIDALAAGVTLPTIGFDPAVTVALIAVITFALSWGGVRLGKSVGARFGRGAEIFGGLILIAIGCRILAQHTGMI